MKECMEVFDECLKEECEKGGGYAVIDMNQMLGNLTSVCFLNLQTPSGQYSLRSQLLIVRACNKYDVYKIGGH
jgi:hypothetical protein